MLPSKTTAASIKSSALGSGRSSVMSSLAKAGGKYRNVAGKNSQSFIDQVSKGIKRSEGYKTVVTRNIQKDIKGTVGLNPEKSKFKKAKI